MKKKKNQFLSKLHDDEEDFDNDMDVFDHQPDPEMDADTKVTKQHNKKRQQKALEKRGFKLIEDDGDNGVERTKIKPLVKLISFINQYLEILKGFT